MMINRLNEKIKKTMIVLMFGGFYKDAVFVISWTYENLCPYYYVYTYCSRGPIPVAVKML